MTGGSLAAWAAERYPDAPPLPVGGPVARLRAAGGEAWSPDEVGRSYERSLATESRRAAGAFYTPRDVADGVVALALPAPSEIDVVLDPAVGGGAFLLAVARRLELAGLSRRQIVGECLYGIDIDGGALEATAVALALWAGPDANGWVDARPHLHLIDTITTEPAALLARLGTDGFSAVVGNPPYLGQLRERTVRGRDLAARVEAALPGVGGAYTDAAALFLLVATRLTRPGGRAALLVPESLLSARDASGVRAAVLEQSRLEHLWVATEAVFAASARVCAPVLRRESRRRSRSGRVTRSTGRAFRSADSAPVPAEGESWGHLVATVHGVPAVDLPGEGGRLADRAEVTAGFRQQFYGIQPFVSEASLVDDPTGDRPRLVTSGSIDPLTCRWGEQPITFDRRRWDAPVIDLAALERGDAPLHRWTVDQLRPKVVVATQTRVIEAAVDADGRWYPSTPVVAAAPDDGDLWELAAVLCAPPVSAWLHGRLAGSALAAGHLRVTARALREIPWPTGRVELRRGAELARAASSTGGAEERRARLLELGEIMTRAYLAPPEVYEWWAASLPAPLRA